MKMELNFFKFIFDVCIISSVLIVSEQTIFECHADVCNVRQVHQFCSSTYKYCRDCHEIKGDCGTAAQPLNCTGYCQEMAVAEALKQIRESNEKSCLVVPVMLNIENGYVSAPLHNNSRIPAGSELVYSCHNGYNLEGPDTLVCNGNGTWKPTIMPYCFNNTWIENSCLVVPVMLNIENGYVSAPLRNDSRIPAGTKLVYICNTGYTLEGPDTLVCNGNETWTPTIMPYCFNNDCIAFKIATLSLTVLCVLGLAATILICYKIKKNKKTISRTSTDSSLHYDVEALLGAENQSVHDEHETPPVPDGATGRQHTNEEIRPLKAPVLPSAPPAEPNTDGRDGQETLNKSSSPSRDTRGQDIVINMQINNQAVNVYRPPETHGKDKGRDDHLPCDPARENKKSIDEKMPTEESDEVNAVEETTDEKKGRGTKPLPARDADSQTRAKSTQEMFEAKEATYKGPQPVPAAKEESIQSPTKETREGNTLNMVGIQNSTFPKSDIRSTETKVSEAKLPEKLNDHNFTQEFADLKET